MYFFSPRVVKLIIVFFIAMLACFPGKTDAYVTFGGKWEDPTYIRVYTDPSVDSIGFTGATDHGIAAWDSEKIRAWYSGSPNAPIKWYGSSSDLGDFYADTLNYSGSRPSWTGIYTNSVVRWNGPVAEELNSNRLKETATHEMGHVLGLAHSNTTQAIMRATGWIYGTYPIDDDWNGINAIY